VPEGADTILIQEDAETLDDNRVSTRFKVVKGRHIRPRGQDFTQGEVVLGEHTLLDFSHLTVAAAMNHPSLTVYRRPKVAILATGDELLMPGSTPAAGQIIASNTIGEIAPVCNICGDVLQLRSMLAYHVDIA